MKEKILISFSGGRTSAYMTWWMLNEWADRHKYEMIVVFANTGMERPETLAFVHQCDWQLGFNTVWVEAVVNMQGNKGTKSRVVNFETASRNGEPFEAVISKYGIPCKPYPHCTRELKLQPIVDYARVIGWKIYDTAIGIRIDEPKRLNWHKAIANSLMYPLAKEKPTTQQMVNEWWSLAPFDLQLKPYEGNCTMCWKKSLRKLTLIAKENPGLLDWWQEMEQKYGEYIPESRQHNLNIKTPITFFRQNMSASDIKRLSLAPAPPNLFSAILDEGEGDPCQESCEVF